MSKILSEKELSHLQTQITKLQNLHNKLCAVGKEVNTYTMLVTSESLNHCITNYEIELRE